MVMTLGARLRELREEKDLSLRELSRRVGEASAAFLSDVELGRRFPSEKTLANLASALGTSVEDLKQYDPRPPIEEMKRLANANPALGFAFRKLAELPAETLLKLAGEIPPTPPSKGKK